MPMCQTTSPKLSSPKTQNKISMYKNGLSRIAAVPVATLGIILSGCAYSSDTYPERGIVISKDMEVVDGDCTFSYENVCMAYDQETEYSVTIADCKKAAHGVIELANDDYLRRHIANPSDFPITSSGSVVKEDNTERFCAAKIVVSKETYDETEIGTLFVDPQEFQCKSHAIIALQTSVSNLYYSSNSREGFLMYALQ